MYSYSVRNVIFECHVIVLFIFIVSNILVPTNISCPRTLWKLYQQLVKKKGMSIEQVVFFFWRYQQYHMASHRYDYEPIFVYLKDKDTKPHLIVNGGLGGASCSFHKNEVRPRTGK